jgi:manganese-transporting P-type ATPase
MYRPESKVDLEADFKPSLLNSAIYLVQLIQQVSTFAINYQGRPFRESLRENRTMFWSIVAVTGIAFACSIEFIPELNQKLKLVKFTAEFQQVLTLTMLVDYLGCWIIEQGFKWAFSDNKPKEIATRNRKVDKKNV